MKELQEIFKTTVQMPDSRAAVINIFHSNIYVKDQLLAQLKPYDLSLEQFNVLRILRGQKGKSINLQDIQQRMVNKMSNTTRLVDKLLKKNFVERHLSQQNRRKVDISITKLGLKILKGLDPLILSVENSITENLSSDELKQLNILLLKLKS
ncbi:MarR family winged helix-turn-helix transcriptional regulator [Winogradskyella immobilis]|uniref:MarR family transcriptional regulator n=1 Tax=Winogradskyella immobilis TaxID=2816852 RepID=A0ABS8ELI1_9FLAO|nr:MarR family transcriptional regulator [Winogradskyella immobilis]MCC1484075.1 MarR family transcriptional regulator [Winogradskyella immobilis]MCG0016167.1 MarR family transcriptional regulator [Winogradskyella immobilis]